MTNAENDHLLEEIKEFSDLSDYLNDPEFDAALKIVVSLIRKPDMLPQRASSAIVELQAIGFKFAMAKTYYMTINKDKDKKNIYWKADEAINRLVDALKYIARN